MARAAHVGNIAAVQELIKAKGDPLTKDNNGWTPLHRAVQADSRDDHLAVVKEMLSHIRQRHRDYYSVVEGGNSPWHLTESSKIREALQAAEFHDENGRLIKQVPPA